MTAPATPELLARARSIISFAVGYRDNQARANLLERAQIKDSRVTSWFDSSKNAVPTIEELIRLAEAAGVPRRFAERGFDDLEEIDLYGAKGIKREVAELREGLAEQSQAVLAATGQLASLREQVDHLRRRQQP